MKLASQHKNPYRIHDPSNLFEVFFNSSHPELKDRRRILDYKGRVFRSDGEALKFFENEGIDWTRLKLVPRWELDGDGTVLIRGHIAERVPSGRKDLMEILAESGRAG